MGCTYHILPYKYVRILKEEGIEIQKPEVVDGFKETLFSVYTREDAHMSSHWLWQRAQSLYKPKPDIYLSCVCMCLYVYMLSHAPRHACGGQRKTPENRSLSLQHVSTQDWTQVSDLAVGDFTHRSHFTCLRNVPVVLFLVGIVYTGRRVNIPFNLTFRCPDVIFTATRSLACCLLP